MKSISLSFIIISIQSYFANTATSQVTDNVETRINVLKQEIIHEIQGLQREGASDQYSDAYQYVDNDDKPIKPILDTDKRKFKNRFKLPEIISTTTKKYVASDTSNDEKHLRMENHKAIEISDHHKKVSHQKDIFYRKMFSNDEERNKPQKWTHCLDLLTPYLKGYKTNITTKYLMARDHTIVRLAQLLSINVTDSTKDEIRSILYEISNLQLRIFQWDYNAIRTIFNAIIKDGPHDFRRLKYGLKEIFANWKLDTSDISSFLKQTRIFRPPCIQISEFEGSTLTTKVIRYDKLTTKKCTKIVSDSEENNDNDDCSN